MNFVNGDHLSNLKYKCAIVCKKSETYTNAYGQNCFERTPKYLKKQHETSSVMYWRDKRQHLENAMGIAFYLNFI